MSDPAPEAAAADPHYPLDALTNFNAIMVGSFFPQDDREAHIYRSGKFLRMEGPEGIGYYLADLSRQETYHVWAGGCARDNHIYFRAAPWGAAARPGAKVERVPAGTETIDGHACQVEEVDVTSPEQTAPLKMKFWEAEDLQGFPIQIEFLRPKTHDKIVTYKNIYVGPQDPTLFIHPKSCEPPIESGRHVVLPSGPPKSAPKPDAKSPASPGAPPASNPPQ